MGASLFEFAICQLRKRKLGNYPIVIFPTQRLRDPILVKDGINARLARGDCPDYLVRNPVNIGAERPKSRKYPPGAVSPDVHMESWTPWKIVTTSKDADHASRIERIGTFNGDAAFTLAFRIPHNHSHVFAFHKPT
jgi:hypothetical protein